MTSHKNTQQDLSENVNIDSTNRTVLTTSQPIIRIKIKQNLSNDIDKADVDESTGKIIRPTSPPDHESSPSKTPLESNFRENILSIAGKHRDSDVSGKNQTQIRNASKKVTQNVMQTSGRRGGNQTIRGKSGALDCEVINYSAMSKVYALKKLFRMNLIRLHQFNLYVLCVLLRFFVRNTDSVNTRLTAS